jgi:hypothetical protein
MELNREPKSETERDKHSTSDKEMCFGMMQHPWHLGFGLYMTRTPAAILVWNWEEEAKQEREKRVTPEFGERKEEKILPPNSGRYTINVQNINLIELYIWLSMSSFTFSTYQSTIA